MAVVTVGYTIPGQEMVKFTSSRQSRRLVYARINEAYRAGGMPGVRSFLASREAWIGKEENREA